MRERNDRSFEDYESMFGTAMGSIAFKVKKSFLEKASILNFCQKCVLSIFRVKKKKIKEVLLEIFIKHAIFLFGTTF
jgi:hypothetical protein